MKSLVARLVLGIAGLAASMHCAAQTFVDVTSQVTISRSGLLLDRATNTFNSSVTIASNSGTVLNGPLVLVISNLSPASVTLANASGRAPSGRPFVSVPIPADGLIAGTNSARVTLAFNNPTRAAFTFSASVSAVAIQPQPLPAGATGPLIESVPPTAAVVGKALSYPVIASSANPSSLVYALSTAPAGMTINAATGLVQWTPGAAEAGDQAVTVDVKDSAGQTSQSFTLSVFASTPVATTTILAASGGVITVNAPGSPINGLTISIPAGALSANTTFTVSQLISPPTLGGTPRFFMAGFSISPDGVALASPATAELRYDPTRFATDQGIALENFLGMYFLQTSTGNVQSVASSVDTVNHVFTANLPHFSAWEITNVARLCPPPTQAADCANTYSPSPASALLPAVLVHGFLTPTTLANSTSGNICGIVMGNEGTWGQLRYLLGELDAADVGRIDAWRFDWDSCNVPFEESAANLGLALAYMESLPTSRSPNLVNLVAHSFGGILIRTYLEGQALVGGVVPYPYNNDVNRAMTIGSPHTGIGSGIGGGPAYSTFFASFCAALANLSGQPETCFEAGTAQAQLPGGIAGEGNFLRNLDGTILPFLNASVTPALLNGFTPPSYLHIKGQTLNYSLFGLAGSLGLHADDGLITVAGAQLCGGSPFDVCLGGGVQGPNCGAALFCETTIASSASDAPGLCHSPALSGITCNPNSAGPLGPQPNIGMAAVADTSHPLWLTICKMAGCLPEIAVTLSPSAAGGTVTSAPNGFNSTAINCGAACSALYDTGTTVTLTATPATGYTFTAWSGACSGTAPTCTLTMADDQLLTGYPVTAKFSPGQALINCVCSTKAITVNEGGVTYPGTNVSVTFSGTVPATLGYFLNLGGPVSVSPPCQLLLSVDGVTYACDYFSSNESTITTSCGLWLPQLYTLYVPGYGEFNTLCVESSNPPVDANWSQTWTVIAPVQAPIWRVTNELYVLTVGQNGSYSVASLAQAAANCAGP
jgi:uncharacterized repeat protein (TIGR02543 family)